MTESFAMRANREMFSALRLYRGGGKKTHLTECSKLLEGDRLAKAGRDIAGVEAE